jgi:hypothetical protein
MNPTTPSGTRTREISIPLGRRHASAVSPTGSGQGGDLAKPRRHLLDAALGERETVHEGARQPRRSRAGQIGTIGVEHEADLLLEPPRHLLERVVLRSRGSERERAGRLLGRPRLARYMGQHVHISFLPGRRAPPGCPGE